MTATRAARLLVISHLLVLAFGVWPVREAGADAIVVSRAMFATTIAEYYIEDDRVTVELEIGVPDLGAFRNLLPDEIYERLGNAPRPLGERLRDFFAEDLVIALPDGTPLPGRVLEMSPRPRVERDEITGAPVSGKSGQEETVIQVRLEYALSNEAPNLTISAPASGKSASIGFVVYDHGIPVNDFRYLGARYTLVLDWEDPWYTRFRSRNLRRRHFAPMSGFVYIEPYEVRKEIVVRPKDLQHWVDLGLAGRDTIAVEIQGELKRKVGEFLREHHVVTIDGEAIAPDLAQVNFLERTLRSSRVIDPARPLDVNAAMLGVIFVYPVDGLPQQVTMDWDLFNERIQVIPASAVDQAGPMLTLLEPDYRVLEWRNFLKYPELPSLAVISPPPHWLAAWAARLRWPLIAATLGCLAWLLYCLRRRGRGMIPSIATTLVVASVGAGAFWLARETSMTQVRAAEVVGGLLRNVYHAFDFRAEERSYDILAKSVEGDLLTDVYLETRRGLELASQGGARAKVKEVELTELAIEPSDTDSAIGFVADATWTVTGSVGHWGHVHRRTNQYRALLTVEPVAGAWKLTGAQILEEKRL